MRAANLLFAITCLFYTACNDDHAEKKIQTFKWLIGSWEMQNAEGTITESWQPVNDTLMDGRSDLIKGDTVIPLEKIRLLRRSNEFYYEAKAAGQNNEQPVEFKLSSFSDSGFIAENSAHDFPKRIIYKLVNKDSIHAMIDGGSAMPDKKSDFYYSRKKLSYGRF